MSEFSFEEENIKKMTKDKTNVLKWYGVNMKEEVFHVGSPDLSDPYSGAPIYVPPKDQLEETMAMVQQVVETQAEAPYEEPVATNEGEVFDSNSMSEEELNLANEIYQRLMNEAAADEMARQAEIEAIKRQQEATSADYNAETGSYSGLYGKKPMNDSEAEALASIMNTNSSYSKSIEDIIKENQN